MTFFKLRPKSLNEKIAKREIRFAGILGILSSLVHLVLSSADLFFSIPIYEIFGVNSSNENYFIFLSEAISFFASVILLSSRSIKAAYYLLSVSVINLIISLPDLDVRLICGSLVMSLFFARAVESTKFLRDQ